MSDTNTPVPLFSPDTAAYAAKLIEAGFTVYADQEPKRHGIRRLPTSWFHYSQTVDGVERFGTYQGADRFSFNGPDHTMPIAPSRLNGSSAHVGAFWGDDATLNMDTLPVESVEMARIVARAENWCPANAEPTQRLVTLANSGASVPRRYYLGAMLRNSTPWGIGTHYTPVTGDAL